MSLAQVNLKLPCELETKIGPAFKDLGHMLELLTTTKCLVGRTGFVLCNFDVDVLAVLLIVSFLPLTYLSEYRLGRVFVTALKLLLRRCLYSLNIVIVHV
jgi:hypothetical protein